jgi:hydroxymethylbilane synthase
VVRVNVPSGLQRLAGGDYDAIVLAAAGLKRLGLESRITQLLSTEEFPPAVSQGAIGVCARAGDARARMWTDPLDDPGTRLATTAERALLETIEGGCQVPLGALAEIRAATLRLHAAVCSLDGTRLLAASGEADATQGGARALGERLAAELLGRGAAELIAEERGAQGRAQAP